MKSRLLLVALVASVSLTGCGGAPSPAPAPSSSTPSPTASPTPTPPQLPAAATKRTPAGAKAFVRHFIDLMRLTAETGDANAIRSVSSPDCAGCLSFAEGMERIYRNGGYVKGGTWRARQLITYGFDGNRFPVDALVDAGPQQYVRRAGGPVQHAKAFHHQLHAFATTWVGGRWVMLELDPQS